MGGSKFKEKKSRDPIRICNYVPEYRYPSDRDACHEHAERKMDFQSNSHMSRDVQICNYGHKHACPSDRDACHGHVERKMEIKSKAHIEERKMEIQADAYVEMAKYSSRNQIGYGGNAYEENGNRGQFMLKYH